MGDYTDTFYCCGTDFSLEDEKNIKWFERLEDLKFNKPCWKECGIVELITTDEGETLYHLWLEKGSLNEN